MDIQTEDTEVKEDDTIQTLDSQQDLKGDFITLQVGERRFVTYPSTLAAESSYFTSLLSDRWRRDGTYFIDADGDLFTYILRYLRSGVLPVFL